MKTLTELFEQIHFDGDPEPWEEEEVSQEYDTSELEDNEELDSVEEDEELYYDYEENGFLEKLQPPRPGLVPKSGDYEHPFRWILPKDSVESNEKNNGQNWEFNAEKISFDEKINMLRRVGTKNYLKIIGVEQTDNDFIIDSIYAFAARDEGYENLPAIFAHIDGKHKIRDQEISNALLLREDDPNFKGAFVNALNKIERVSSIVSHLKKISQIYLEKKYGNSFQIYRGGKYKYRGGRVRSWSLDKNVADSFARHYEGAVDSVIVSPEEVSL